MIFQRGGIELKERRGIIRNGFPGIPNSGAQYWRRFLDISELLALYRLNETTGTTAYDSSGNGFHGTMVGVNQGGDTGPDGSPAITLDGMVDYVNIYSAALSAAFTSQATGGSGSLCIWMKVPALSIWDDGQERRQVTLRVDGSNQSYHRKSVAIRNIAGIYQAGGVFEIEPFGTLSNDWIFMVTTWDKPTDNQFKLYVDGVLIGTDGALGVWVNPLSATNTVIGASSTGPAFVWEGSLAICAIYSKPLTQPEIDTLATV